MSCLKAERRPSPRTQSLSPPQNQTESAGAQELGGPEKYKINITYRTCTIDNHSNGVRIV